MRHDVTYTMWRHFRFCHLVFGFGWCYFSLKFSIHILARKKIQMNWPYYYTQTLIYISNLNIMNFTIQWTKPSSHFKDLLSILRFIQWIEQKGYDGRVRYIKVWVYIQIKKMETEKKSLKRKAIFAKVCTLIVPTLTQRGTYCGE